MGDSTARQPDAGGIEVIAKAQGSPFTDEYFALDLPVAPAVMVSDEILAEGTDVSQGVLETAICLHLGLPAPAPAIKGVVDRLL